MRILVVTQYCWPEQFRINDIVKSLQERGIKVDVLTGQPNYPEGKTYSGYKPYKNQVENWDGINIYRVPLFPRGTSGSIRLVLNYISFIISGLIFGPIHLRKKKYDVIFIYGVSPILAAIPAIFIGWLKNNKTVLWVQDLWPESLSATGYIRNEYILKGVSKIVAWIYNSCDLILAQSKAFKTSINRLSPEKDVVYYPNSVDSSFAQPSSIDVELPQIDALNNKFSVVFAGNIGSAQAVNIIIDAAKILEKNKDICFVVIGDGSKKKWMDEQVDELNLDNVILPGRFPIECMPGLMEKASALLVTLTDQPIFAATVPNKIQAYLAAGRPIIASVNGEGGRVVEEAGAGISVPAENAVALSEAIIDLYRMQPAMRDNLGKNGRNYFREHFDHEQLVTDLIGHFNSLIKLTRE